MANLAEIEAHIAGIKAQITATEEHLVSLNKQLEDAHQEAAAARQLDEAYRGGMPDEWQRETMEVLSHHSPFSLASPSMTSTSISTPSAFAPSSKQWPLSADEYRRYGRQLIMPEIGIKGQLRLKAARVLIVGVGGLGCPAATYLAGAGIGTIGLVDGDTVEASNLHRQIAHSTSRVGTSKVSSAITNLKDLNPNVNFIAHRAHLDAASAVSMFHNYDLVLDCTDHPTSRYLISDACVVARKPLVSASALKTEGQLIVLNYPPKAPGDSNGGPCYRCIFPKPPPPETLTSCSEGGIIGPVVGVMGVLQSLEAIKILTRPMPDTAPQPSLLLFAPYSSGQPFRSVRMRGRRDDCAACSASPSVTAASMSLGEIDYVRFCGSAVIDPLPSDQRITPGQLSGAIDRGSSLSILDVRPTPEHDIASLPGSINVPYTDLATALVAAQSERPSWLDAQDLVVVCRLGNDSQRAVRAIREAGLARGNVVDMRNGFRGWRADVDSSWPDY